MIVEAPSVNVTDEQITTDARMKALRTIRVKLSRDPQFFRTYKPLLDQIERALIHLIKLEAEYESRQPTT